MDLQRARLPPVGLDDVEAPGSEPAAEAAALAEDRDDFVGAEQTPDCQSHEIRLILSHLAA